MALTTPPKPYTGRGQSTLFGLAYHVRMPDGQWVLKFKWKLIGAICASAFFLTYFVAAGAFFWWHRYYREVKDTSFGDMMLYVIPNQIPFTNIQFLPDFLSDPIYAARIRQQAKLGDHIFENRANVYDIMTAAKLSPKNLSAQMTAARLLMDPIYRINRIDEAFNALDSTLQYALDNKNFIIEYTSLCFQYDQDRRVIAAAEKYLNDTADPKVTPAGKKDAPKSAVTDDVRTALATSYAEALFLQGKLTQSHEILEKYDLLKTLSGVLLEGQILWENSEKERAVAFLNKIVTELKGGAGSDKVLYSLAKLYWEDNRKVEALRTFGYICILQPTDFRAFIYQLPLLSDEQDKAQLNDSIEKIIERFGANENAMLSLGSYAADRGNCELQDRIYELAIKNRFTRLANFRLLRAETLLMGGRVADASKDMNELFAQNPPWLRNPLIRGQFDALQMLAHYSSNRADLGILIYNKLTNENTMSVAMMVSIARRLQKINRPDEAKAMLCGAYTRNHNHLGALLELVKITLASESTRELGEYIEHLINARRPPRYVLQSAYDHLASDRFIFTPNRDKLLDGVQEMLKTRVLPVNELEKDWPTY